MAEKRLILRLEAENGKLVKKLAESEQRLRRTEAQMTGSVNNINSGFVRASQGAERFGKAANDSTGGTNRMRGAVGQLGFQVQDIAVQLQSGQNAMLVFGQQGSQIASIFGPTGAVIGAILAVGAALGTALIPNLFSSTDALKKLETAFGSVDKIIKETKGSVIIITDEFAKLAGEANKLSAARIKIALGEIGDALEAAKSETLNLAQALSPSELGGRFNRTFLLFKTLTGRLEEGTIGLDEYAKQVSKLFVGDEASSREFRETLKEVLDLTEKSNKLRNTQMQLESGLGSAVSESRAEAIEKEAKALDKAADATAKLTNSRMFSLDDAVFAVEDSLRLQTEIVSDSFNERLALLSAYKKQYIDEVEYANQLEIELEQEKNQQLKMIALGATSTILNGFSMFTTQMEQMAEDGSRVQKAFFLINQAIAATSAIIKGFQAAAATRLAYAELAAITGNPALASAGIGMANTQIALGFATAGMIAGQTLASFEGGGFTGSGPRSGGMDGKGGMLAMVHPNEKITDLTKGSEGVSIQITNNVSNARPRAEVDRDGVIKIVIDELGNQSSRMRSVLHQTSNITPKGTR